MKARIACFDMKGEQRGKGGFFPDHLALLQVLGLVEPRDSMATHVKLFRVDANLNFEVDEPCDVCGYRPMEKCAIDNGPWCMGRHASCT